MAETFPIGLPWNYPLWGEWGRSIWAPPRYRLQRRVLVPTPSAPAESPQKPLSLDEVILHLRLAPEAKTGPEAPLLEGMIAAATRHLEDYAGITVMRSEWRMTLRNFPPVWNDPLELPMPPFEELRAIEIRGQAQNIDDYAVELDEMYPARLYPKSGWLRWAWSPTPAMIVIDWSAGYENAADVPSTWKQALLMAIAFWYEQREAQAQYNLYPVIELGWRDLLTHHRMPGFA